MGFCTQIHSVILGRKKTQELEKSGVKQHEWSVN